MDIFLRAIAIFSEVVLLAAITYVVLNGVKLINFELWGGPKYEKAVAIVLLAIGLRLGIAHRFLRRVAMPSWAAPVQETGATLFDHLRTVLNRQDITFGVSLGTPGPHGKPVVQVLTREGAVVAYVKLGWNDVTKTLVENEVEMLARVRCASPRSFMVPSIIHAGSWENRFLCVQSPSPSTSGHGPQSLTREYAAVLREMNSFHTKPMCLEDSSFWDRVLTRIETVENTYYRDVLERGLRPVECPAGGRSAVPVRLGIRSVASATRV